MKIEQGLSSYTRFQLWCVAFIVLLLVLPHVHAAPIHDAVKAGDLAAVERILEENPRAWDTNDDYSGHAPAGLAANGGHLDIFQLFVANGFSLGDEDGEWSNDIQSNDEEGEGLILSAGQRAVLVWGLDQDINIEGYWFEATLIDMVRANDIESAEILLQAGVSPNDEGGGRKTAIDHAVSEDMQTLLVGYGAESGEKAALILMALNYASLFIPLFLILAAFVYLTIRLSKSKSSKKIAFFSTLSVLVAALLWFAGGTIARELRMTFGDTSALLMSIFFFKAVPVFILFRALPLMKRAAQLKITSADEILKKDARPPILYLRSFQNDASYRKRPWWFWLTMWFYPIAIGVPRSSHEQLLTATLSKVGPVVAIGDPDEELPKLGAHRLYVDHDTWKQTVLDLMEKSQLIVLRIGLTEGILWELKNAIDRLAPEKFVIWIVPGKGSNVDEANKLAKHLHDKSADILPQAIPLDICKQEFIYFGQGWTPHAAKNLKSVIAALQIKRTKKSQEQLPNAPSPGY